MQQALELALDRAEYVIESARQKPPKRKYLSTGRKSVFQKLYDLYIEECEKEPEVKKLRRNVNLLEKLVMQETLSCLVVNLYPGNEGYSLMLRGKNGSDSETIRLPYEEGELLEYLDAEELPPILVDLLEKSQCLEHEMKHYRKQYENWFIVGYVNIFHCGCVIAEIRDYRQSSNMKSPGYQSKHILLRPTMQTLICDVHSITSDNHKWTQVIARKEMIDLKISSLGYLNEEDKLLLESQLILATTEPLCLDPSIAVTCTANRLLYNKQKMNTHPMKRCFKRYSRSSLNRQQDLSHCLPPPQLKLLDFLQKRKERKIGQHYDLKISKAGNCVDMWKRSPCNLTVPSEVDVEKYAKVEKSIKSDDSQPTVWPAHDVKDDYVFECEAGNQKTKLTIFQSLGDPLYYGKIQPCKEDEEFDSQMSPSHSSTEDHSNWFIIGSKTDAERVVNQYQELVQNEAKCPVKMLHSSSGSANLSQLSPGKETEPETVSVQSSVLGKGIKHRPPPIKLPSSSGNSSTGNYFTPQQASSFLKSPTPPPASKPPSLSRKSSVDLSQVSMLSPAALSPASSSQRSGTPKPSTPTPTHSSTPHPPDAQSSTPIIPTTPTPQDSGFTPQPTLLTQFAQQQRSLSQAMPVTTIPLPTMVTSITPGTTATQVMANSAGLNFINVVGSVCGAQALMNGSNPVLGCNTGAITPAGINLSGLLPSGGLLPNALPGTMQAASQAGVPFDLKTTSSLRPLNLLQLPGGSLIFNTLQQQQQQQQQQLSQFTSQQLQQPTTSSPQQPGEQGSEQGSTSQEKALSAQHAAVINLAGVGSFMQSQAAVLSQLGSAENRPEQSLPQQRFQLSSAFQQQQQQIQQLRFLQHQMAMAAATAQTAQLHCQRHTGNQSKSKMKRGTPTTPKF